jgi:choline-sulfatase
VSTSQHLGRGWRAALAVATLMGLSSACSKDAPPARPGSQTPTVPAASMAPPSTPGVAAPVPSAAAAAAPAAVAGPPKDCNVIVLSIDSLRADMPWNGYPRAIAPHLTELEKKAVSFTRAYSMSSYTSMSLGGLLGGRIPSELQRSGYFFGTYRHDVFFPALLQKAGVHTSGVMAHMYFKAAGFDQGFDDWQIVPGISFDPNTDRDVTSPQSERLAEKALGDPANDSRRFFFWAHFLDPHDLYLRHPGIDWGKTDRDRYDGEVTFTDQSIGKLLDFIATRPWAARTVLIVTSDHGEEFGENAMTRHGFEVWEPLVHVPLFFIAPGAVPRHIDVLRSAVDLAPTILDFFGVAPDPSYQGTSLVREIYGAPSPERDVVVDLPMTSDNGRRRALLHGTEKLICFDNDGYCRLYDLTRDPTEHSPITKGDDWKEMKARYDAFGKTVREVPPYACTGDCLNSSARRKALESPAAK